MPISVTHRVDVDQHQAGLGGRVLRHNPLGAIGRANADAIAAAQTDGHQRGGERVDTRAELAPRPRDALMTVDEDERRETKHGIREEMKSIVREKMPKIVMCG